MNNPATLKTFVLCVQNIAKDVGKTCETLNLLMHPSSRFATDLDEIHSAKVDELMDFVCHVNQEDVDIVQRVQVFR